MDRKRTAITMAICCICLLVSFHEVLATDYSVTATNNIRKTTNEVGSSCSPVSLTYWSGGNGSRAQLPNTLNAYTPQTLTIKNAGSCSSIELTATCHYFQTSYTNYGKLSQTAWSHWVDDTKTQSLPCGCHAASIELELTPQGSVTNTVMAIKCQ